MRRQMARLALLLTLAVVGLGADIRAQRAASEYAVKASFIFNVANFVEWPASAFPSSSAPLKVAVVAAHPVPDFAAALQGKAIRGHAVVVEQYTNAERIEGSHVIFVTSDAVSQVRAMLKTADGHPVLTMVEEDAETPGAAVVSMGIVQAKLAFSVNLDAADAAGLQMNPNLLKLAKAVQSNRARTK
ncbi:MAG: YfiR family protein [Vicinamibacterales bacterium]